jgi:hypothetical protein
MELYAKLNNRQEVIQFPVLLPYKLEAGLARYNNLVLVSQDDKPEYVDWKKQAVPVGLKKSIDFKNPKNFFKAVYEVKSVVDNTTDFKTKQNKFLEVYNEYKNTNYKVFQQKVKDLTGDYKQEEFDTWDQQLAEAKAYISTKEEGLLLKNISNERGISLQNLVDKIISKSNSYNSTYGKLLGKYRKNQEILDSIDLKNEATWDGVNNYNWNL